MVDELELWKISSILGDVGDPLEKEREERQAEAVELRAARQRVRGGRPPADHSLLHARLAHARGEGPKPEPKAIPMSQLSALGQAFRP